MPRMLRFEEPGSLVHIMARGLDGTPIFRDDDDRLVFLRRFSLNRSRCGYKCFAWCLMPNHYHFFLQCSEKPLSSLMRPLNGGYARWFNKKYSRRGYLFQERYKSVLCQDTEYADELIRYVHLNPIRSGLVKSLASLARWRWCGHAFLVGTEGALGTAFQDRDSCLKRFARVKSKAVRVYLDFFADGLDMTQPEFAGLPDTTESTEIQGAFKGWPAVIGDPEFARETMNRHEIACRRRHRTADYQHSRFFLHGDVEKTC